MTTVGRNHVFALVAAWCLFSPALLAQENKSGAEQKPLDFEKELERIRGDYDRRFAELESRVNANQKNQAVSNNPLRLIDISFVILTDLGASTAKEVDFQSLQYGGHDPKRRGFTAGNSELSLGGVIDPHFRGDANIVYFISPEGESEVELEEAYLTTLSMPWDLQARVGQFFNRFGRSNALHPHQWDFADQPVTLSRFFGPDGLRGPGAELSSLLPLPFFAEASFGVQNANGETAVSFLGEAGETVAGRTLLSADVDSPADLLYLARLRTAFDLSEELTLVPGASALFGPNASGTDTRTTVHGADVYLKWKPLDAQQGFPFVSLQSEWIRRVYEAGADAGASLPEETLREWGQYTQALWGFRRGWVAGARYENAQGGDASDVLRDDRKRLSANLTFYPSEFSKIRLQYNYDRSQFLDDPAHSVIVQFEILFGAHAAHKF